MTDPELRQLALDIVDGHVVGTWSMRERPDQVSITFPVVQMLTDDQFKAVSHSAHIYEYRSEAASMGVNGQPMFFSFKILALEDWEPLRHMLDELMQQRAAFIGTPDA